MGRSATQLYGVPEIGEVCLREDVLHWDPGKKIVVARGKPMVGCAIFMAMIVAVAAGIVGGIVVRGALAATGRDPDLFSFRDVFLIVAFVTGGIAYLLIRGRDRETTFDWTTRQVLVRSGTTRRAYRMDDIMRIRVRSLPDRCARVEVQLSHKTIPVLDTLDPRDDAAVRCGQLGPVARRLAEALVVPYELESGQDVAGKSDEALATDYLKLGQHAAGEAWLAQHFGRDNTEEKLREAVSYFTRVSELNITSVEPHLEIARACRRLKKYDQALQVLSAAIRADQQSAAAYLERGKTYWLMSDYDQAEADCTTAIQLKPTAEAYLERALVRGLKDQYAEAVSDCDAAIRLEPENPEGHARRAECLNDWFQEEENPDLMAQAVVSHTEAIRLDPEDNSYRVDRGAAYVALGQCENAIADLTWSLARDPESHVAFRYRGEAFLKSGQLQQALQDLNKAISLSPDDVFAFELRAKVHRLLGDMPQATRDEQRAAELWETD